MAQQLSKKAVVGKYTDANEWTGGCTLELKANGTFVYYCSYDLEIMDNKSDGKWKLKGDTVLLTSKYQPPKKFYRLVSKTPPASADTCNYITFLNYTGKPLSYNPYGWGSVEVYYPNRCDTFYIDSVGKVKLPGLNGATEIKVFVKYNFYFSLTLDTVSANNYVIQTAKRRKAYRYFKNAIFILSHANGKVSCVGSLCVKD